MSVVIREDDFTDYAKGLGIWEALRDLSGVDQSEDEIKIISATSAN